jgi:hypothetical protein
MKKMWNGELPEGMVELRKEECQRISGGYSLWYYIGYAVGSLFA